MKPPKKSDLGKTWMKPRRDFRQIIAPEYHLIVTEGTETEPQYFHAIKETIDAKYRDRIHLDVNGKGDNTISLFNRAVKDVIHSSNIYKHVCWYTTRMIFLLKTLIRPPHFAKPPVLTKPIIMPFGRTSASSFGSFSISCSFRQTFTGMNTGPSSQNV